MNTKFSLKGQEREVKKIDKSLHWSIEQFIDDFILETLGKEQCPIGQNKTSPNGWGMVHLMFIQICTCAKWFIWKKENMTKGMWETKQSSSGMVHHATSWSKNHGLLSY